MIKATYIQASDLSTLKTDENGNFLIPDHIEIYIKEDPAVLRANRIAELEKELATMTEPSNEELIELGKMGHPYYSIIDELNILR